MGLTLQRVLETLRTPIISSFVNLSSRGGEEENLRPWQRKTEHHRTR
jgi:hypothetical protein